MFDSIFNIITSDEEAQFTTVNLFLALGIAIILGLVISVVYMKTHKTKNPSQSFSVTLVILPAIITIIILLVGNSVARAFSLAGAFSIIRFRSAPGDPKDITYVLFTMAVGLACGMGFLLYGIIVAIVLCLLMIILNFIKFGYSKTNEKLLKITIPENLNYQDAFTDLLNNYTKNHQLIKVQTTNLGSLYDLQYRIICKEKINEKEFLDDLRCRNGNLSITLVLTAAENEF